MHGRVYWITGLSGAGKTTIGKLFYERLKRLFVNTVFLDGDELRKTFGDDLGYSEEERRKCAWRYSKICGLLASQNINVVICTISMFHEIRDWNRLNIDNYVEIYIRVSNDVLIARDQKGLYSKVSYESDTLCVGMEVIAELPKSPDIIIDNNGEKKPEEQVERLWKKLKFDNVISMKNDVKVIAEGAD